MTIASKTFKSISAMALLTLLAKGLGFYREALIASKVGSNASADTLFIALTAIGLLTTLLTLSIGNASVPLFSKLKAPKESLNHLFFPLFVVSFSLALIGYLIVPQWIALMASGFSHTQSKEAQMLVRLGLPAVLFSGGIGLMTGYLQSQSKVVATSLIQLPFNALYIVYLLYLYPLWGTKGIMLTTIVATSFQWLLLAYFLKKAPYKPALKWTLKSDAFNELFKLMLPIMMSIAIIDINKIIDKSLASTLPPGSISALNYASRLNDIVLSVFVLTLATAVFPMLSKAVATSNTARLKHLIHKGIDLILIIAIPSTLGIVILSVPIVRACFERGVFDAQATQWTASALIYYTLGLVAMALRLLLEKVFFAMQDTKTPMFNGIIAITVNIGLNFLFIQFMGHNGLALATAISAWITALLLIGHLRRRIGKLGLKKLVFSTFLYLASAVMMCLCVWKALPLWLKYLSFSPTLALLATALTGATVYFICLVPLKLRQSRPR